MREQTTVPTWALEHMRQQLRPGEEVINAVALKQGLFSGMVLFNTSRGAAVAAKALVGEPRSALLTYPRDLLTFRCTECSARNILIDAEPPVDVHCNHCGGRHHLEKGGAAQAGHRTRPTGKERAETGPKARKEGTTKTSSKGTTSKPAGSGSGSKAKGKPAAKPTAKKAPTKGPSKRAAPGRKRS